MSDPKIPPPPQNPFKKVGAKANRATFLALIAIILSLATGVLSWFSWSQAQLLQDKVDLFAETIKQEEKGYAQALKIQSQTFLDKIDTLEQRFSALQNKINSLTSSTLTEQDTLKQATYLVQMADLHLSIGNNSKAAIELLKLANEQLEKLPANSAQSIRALITKQIALLNKISPFDPNELITKLNELSEQIYALPALPTIPSNQAHSPNQPPSSSTNNSWKEKIKKMSDSLKDLVIIRHNEQPVKSLLSSEQLALLKESIRLKINSAQWAVIHQNTKLYYQSLNSAKNWLETYYPNQKNTGEILATIQTLLEVDLDSQYPNLKDILNAIQDLIYPSEPTQKQKTIQEGDKQ